MCSVLCQFFLRECTRHDMLICYRRTQSFKAAATQSAPPGGGTGENHQITATTNGTSHASKLR